jgi:hypothetical protein
MISFLTSIITLLTFLSFATALFDTIAYRTTIKPFSNTSSLPAEGFVTIFTESSKSVIGYSGIVTNLESNLLASTCTALNGCGVHIHAGRSCFNTTTPGPHYFINTTFPIDPWINERYSTDSTGKANFHSITQIGSIDIEGRAFLGMFCEHELYIPFTKDHILSFFLFLRFTQFIRKMELELVVV